MIGLLDDPAYKGSMAVRALCVIGPASAPSVPAILRSLERNDGTDYASYASKAMAAIGVGAKPAIPWLIETANKQNTISKYAANALAKMGKHAESAIPDLEKLANSKNKSIASAAKNAIAKISAD